MFYIGVWDFFFLEFKSFRFWKLFVTLHSEVSEQLIYNKLKVVKQFYHDFILKKIMSLVKLTIKGISYSQTQNGAYALILNEVDGERKLPIVIGAFEAQSIAIALEKEIKPPRPLTHDLFKSFADRFDIVVKQVIIHKLVDGVFYSSIICERDRKSVV